MWALLRNSNSKVTNTKNSSVIRKDWTMILQHKLNHIFQRAFNFITKKAKIKENKWYFFISSFNSLSAFFILLCLERIVRYWHLIRNFQDLHMMIWSFYNGTTRKGTIALKDCGGITWNKVEIIVISFLICFIRVM